MNRLPNPPAAAEGETIIGHGLRLLAFVLDTGVTATLTDQELERADYAAGFAVTAREIIPAAVDRISDTRHILCAALRRRVAIRPPAEQQRPPLDAENIGPMARLQPAPIQRPPSGQIVKPDVAF